MPPSSTAAAGRTADAQAIFSAAGGACDRASDRAPLVFPRAGDAGRDRTEFGAIVGIDYDPGLHWKWPWDQVVKFERRILSQSYEGETFLTNDNRGLIVDFYVKWKVNNASRFFQATGGVEDIAAERLAEIVKDGIK